MKIGVAAATGNLGRATVKALIDLIGKESVVALVRSPEKAKDLGVEVRRGDYNDCESLEKALSGVDAVLVIPGMVHPDERIKHHRNAIEAAVKSGVKKIVYASIEGPPEGTGFSVIVRCNHTTEEDVRKSGLEWIICRNGIYIEPDIEYIEKYKEVGAVKNCAGDGLCPYTTRDELACAYAHLLTEDKNNGKILNLHGEKLTQEQMTHYLNETFGLNLKVENLSVEDYVKDRITELGEYIGPIIAGIYEGIFKGVYTEQSDFEVAAGRPHQPWKEYFAGLKH